MSTITISLPSQITRQIDSEVKKEGFSTRSEFIRSLIRKYLVKDQLELEEFQVIPLNQLKTELAQTNRYSEEFINSIVKGFEKSSIYEK